MQPKRIERIVQRTEHFGKEVLVETTPLVLAKLPVKAPLHESVLVHPRYAEGTPHEIIEVRGFVRGRTIDVLLPEQFEHNGRRYGIMNFKGAGADAEQEIEMRPLEWFKGGKWGPASRGDNLFSRGWGVVRTSEAERELTAAKTLGIPMTPYLRANSMPREVVEAAAGAVEGIPPLSQIIRLEQSNIREEAGFGTSDPIRLANVDARIISAVLRFAERKQLVHYDGRIPDNRFSDGLFTDAENFEIRPFEQIMVRMLETDDCQYPFLAHLIMDSTNRIDTSETQLYLRILGKKMKINGFANVPFGPMLEHLEKMLSILGKKVAEAVTHSS
jgi:hypothetical protein